MYSTIIIFIAIIGFFTTAQALPVAGDGHSNWPWKRHASPCTKNGTTTVTIGAALSMMKPRETGHVDDGRTNWLWLQPDGIPCTTTTTNAPSSSTVIATAMPRNTANANYGRSSWPWKRGVAPCNNNVTATAATMLSARQTNHIDDGCTNWPWLQRGGSSCTVTMTAPASSLTESVTMTAPASSLTESVTMTAPASSLTESVKIDLGVTKQMKAIIDP